MVKGVVMKFELGKEAVDTITGFTGTIVGYAKYLTGCDQYIIVPRCDDPSKYPEGQWFDENRLKLTEKKEKIIVDTHNTSGACGIAPLY